MAAERSYRVLGTLTPGFPVPGGGGGARPGPYAGFMSFLFIQSKESGNQQSKIYIVNNVAVKAFMFLI